MIIKKDLKKDCWYIGLGYYSNAFWDGKQFNSFDYRYKNLTHKQWHYEEGRSSNYFTPIERVDVEAYIKIMHYLSKFINELKEVF